MQETEHLTSVVDQLAEMKPDVLLVEKSVARDAQNALLERGISLALNVKRANLDRLAQCTGAQVRLQASHEIAEYEGISQPCICTAAAFLQCSVT